MRPAVQAARLRNSARSSIVCLEERMVRTSLGSRISQTNFSIRGRYFAYRLDKTRRRSLRLRGSNVHFIFRPGSLVQTIPFTSFDPNPPFPEPSEPYFHAIETAIQQDPDPSDIIVNQAIAKGTSSFVLSSTSSAPSPGAFYFLRDVNKKETNLRVASEVRGIGGELVLVTGYTAATRTVTIAAPTTQAYPLSTSVQLSALPVGTVVEQNVTISGLKVKGQIYLRYGSHLSVYYWKNFIVSKFQFKYGSLAGLSTSFCSDFSIERGNIQLLTKATLPEGKPWGYSIQLNRCVRGTVKSSSASSAQYILTVESGSCKISAQDISAVDCESSFDIHGGDAQDIMVVRCAGPVPITIGNTSWRRGANGVTLTDCFAEGVRYGGAIRNATLTRVSAKYCVYEYVPKDPNPGAIAPILDTVACLNCSFTMPTGAGNYVLRYPPTPGILSPPTDYQIKDVTFNNCHFNAMNDGPILVVSYNTKIFSNLKFDNCDFLFTASLDNSGISVINDAQTPANSLEIRVKNCDFILPVSRKVIGGTVVPPAVSTTTTFFSETNAGTTPNRRATNISGPFSTLTSADTANNIVFSST